MSERRTYRFGPIEDRGFLGAVRAGQALCVVVGGAVGLLLLGASPTPGRALGAIATFAISVAAASIPLGGRTVEQWLPVAAGWTIRRLTGGHRFQSTAPVTGTRVTAGRCAPPAELDLTAPHALKGVRILELPYHGRLMGAVSEPGGRLLTGVLACRVASFALVDLDGQQRSLAHWGSVLSGCADTAVRRVQWLERTVPAEGNDLARWLQAQHDPRIAPRDSPILDSYLELIDHTTQVSQEHEILIAVQVDTARVRGREKHAAAATLIEETERIADGLRRAGAQIQGALTPGHLALLFRTAFDPYARTNLATVRENEQSSGLSRRDPWPVAAIEGWDHYRTDGAVHATHWIAGWPRVDVGALFLDPLLSHASVVRTVAVTFEPVSADRSIREVEAQVTRDQADRGLRARFGQAETARQEQAYGATRRREAELAAGYSEVRFTGFITVSASNPQRLQGACADVRRDAARARLELHAMYGQHADAFTFTLPLCRGLR